MNGNVYGRALSRMTREDRLLCRAIARMPIEVSPGHWHSKTPKDGGGRVYAARRAAAVEHAGRTAGRLR